MTRIKRTRKRIDRDAATLRRYRWRFMAKARGYVGKSVFRLHELAVRLHELGAYAETTAITDIEYACLRRWAYIDGDCPRGFCRPVTPWFEWMHKNFPCWTRGGRGGRVAKRYQKKATA